MSVDVLRQASSLMRERAEAATPGPWRAHSHPVDFGWISDKRGRPLAEDVDSDDDATHIASWHPAVALAVADWLDETAEFFNPNSAIWGRALAIARAYLGETA